MSEGIKKLFSKIPKNYDLINNILTFGLDHFWRKKTAKIALKFNGDLCLDVCTGTGKQAFFLNKYLNKKIYSIDFCLPMLQKAKNLEGIKIISSNALKLPFKDETFDLITISFATRNLNKNKEELKKAFCEFKRVLKKNGYFLNLETTQPPFFLLKGFLHLYSKTLIKPIGSLFSGSKEAYTYLSSTIPRFYNAKILKEILIESGFSEVDYKYLFPYVVALHISKK